MPEREGLPEHLCARCLYRKIPGHIDWKVCSAPCGICHSDNHIGQPCCKVYATRTWISETYGEEWLDEEKMPPGLRFKPTPEELRILQTYYPETFGELGTEQPIPPHAKPIMPPPPRLYLTTALDSASKVVKFPAPQPPQAPVKQAPVLPWPRRGTGFPPFSPTSIRDAVQIDCFQTITAQAAYWGLSLEELRLADYQQGKIYGTQTAETSTALTKSSTAAKLQAQPPNPASPPVLTPSRPQSILPKAKSADKEDAPPGTALERLSANFRKLKHMHEAMIEQQAIIRQGYSILEKENSSNQETVNILRQENAKLRDELDQLRAQKAGEAGTKRKMDEKHAPSSLDNWTQADYIG